MTPYIQLENIGKSYGDLTLYTGINLTVAQGDKSALIAHNGAGKTTLLRIIAGVESPSEGAVTVTNGVRIGILEQNPQPFTGGTVLDAVFHSDSPLSQAVRFYEDALTANDPELLSEATTRMDAVDAWNLETKAKTILTQLKINDLSLDTSVLSGGQKKRLALAIVLIDDPDVLILDEPTNHLDMEMSQWLEEYLLRSNKTLLMITHDRYFLDRVCNKIFEIDQKQLYAYSGNYSEFMLARERRIEQFNAERDKAQNIYRRELEWMRRMPQARGTKQKFRKEAFAKVEESAFKSREDRKLTLTCDRTRLGTKIFVARDLCKRFGERTILSDFSYTFTRYERMGIVGKNGSGKSTFLNILTGAIPYDSGVLEIGETVRFGYYRQQEDGFDESKRVIDILTDIAENHTVGGSTLSASALLTQFLFAPDEQYGIVGKLSGGERRRLYLLTILIQNPNFLILDEPTNDLDIMTLGVLEEWLDSYDGCLLVVSHDRFFMDKVADNLMIFEGDGRITLFMGNYTQYCNMQYDKRLQEQTVKSQSEKPKVDSRIREKKIKLSFQERQEFERLSNELPLLEKHKTELETLLGSGSFTADRITELSGEYQTVTSQLDSAEMRWLELSELA